MTIEGDCIRKVNEWRRLYQEAERQGSESKGLICHGLAAMFPYDVVVNYYRECGKHFVSPDALQALAMAREDVGSIGADGINGLYANHGNKNSLQILKAFLSVALDKHDGCYDYKTYIAMALFLDSTLLSDSSFESVLEQRLLLLKVLFLDDYRFEARSLLGDEKTTQERRDIHVLQKRLCKITELISAIPERSHFLAPVGPDERAALTMMRRLHGHEVEDSVDRGLGIANMLRQKLLSTSALPMELLLRLSMLPVFTNHEEYNFIRVLQGFEVLFNIVVVGLRTAINHLYERMFREAGLVLKCLCEAFRLEASMFAVLMTMPKEDFMIFRQFTEGASAIQSPQYKLIEILMGSPSPDRRDSPAFKYVPQIRILMERAGLSMDVVLKEQFDASDPESQVVLPEDPDALDMLRQLNQLDLLFLNWKRQHFGIAKRMIGDTVGTGGTDAIEYLANFKGRLFFPQLDAALSSVRTEPTAEIA